MPNPTVLKDLAVSDSGFLFDPRSGATFTLNPSGLAVLRALREGAGLGEIARGLEEEFDGAPKEVREDVLDFVRSLQRNGLVPADFNVD